MSLRVRVFVLVAVQIAALCRSAIAQPEPTTPELVADYKKAQSLYLAGRFADALPLFRRVHTRMASPNANLYVARCLREMGRFAEAYEAMSATLREASGRTQAEPQYAETAATATQELAALEPRVARIRIAVANPPASLRVEVNGARVAAEHLGEPVVVDPETVRIVAEAPGCAVVDTSASVAAGSERTVGIELACAKAPAVGTAAPTVAPMPDRPSSSGGELRTAGFVGVGVGVVGVATFAVAGLMANARYSDIEDACGAGHCLDSSHDADIRQGKQLDTIANIGLVVGIVGLAVGTTMIVLGGPKSRGHSASSRSVSGPMPASRGIVGMW